MDQECSIYIWLLYCIIKIWPKKYFVTLYNDYNANFYPVIIGREMVVILAF